MALESYWPNREEINRCIKAEAESASDAVLLAVHQSLPLLRRDEGSDVASLVSEHDLLEAFLSDDLPQGTLLMPITGASGSGKSHLIRWLAAQLGRDPRARQMHVIRIPKSASLRDVVELVLEPLTDDDRFAEVRESLDKAIAQVTPAEAAIRFSGALEIALNDLKDRLMVELRNDPKGPDRGELRSRANHASKLPGFLNDATLRQHMIDNVLAPIVQRAVNGRADLDPEEEELLPQFQEDDLKIPDSLFSALGQAATPVQNYYLTGLNREDGLGREEAARVLNEVVDQSIQQAFRLDQATGGLTLESIILRVRELLHEQERELVLLIEDFAALSGIQQVLLNVCIQEAVRSGDQVRSRMRTALALTDGYLVGRDTIATRAKQEWIIQQRIEADEVISRTVDLMGAYLNAARWGEEVLRNKYEQSNLVEERDLTAWVDIYQDDVLAPEESDQLAAFGQTSTGIPLFPYNLAAIGELAKRHLRVAGEMRFNPRRIINFLLRDVLLSGRDAFEKAEFPPAAFEGAKASASLANWLASLNLSDVERQRMEALIVYWGGNPGNSTEASIVSREIFNAFRIDRPRQLDESSSDETDSEPPTKVPTKAPSPEPLPPQPPDTDQTPEFAGWVKRLDAWADGTELGQRDAQKLRGILQRLLERAIPWNSLRICKRDLNLLLTIPNARGNEAPAAIRIPVAPDNRDSDGQLRQALLGALRLEESKGHPTYLDADEDSARVATLVERLVQDLIPHLEHQRDTEVRTLAWILRRQSRVLGLISRTRAPQLDLEVRAVRAGVDAKAQKSEPGQDAETRWQQLQYGAMETRSEMRQALIERVGCFQGDGKNAYALDPTLIDFLDDSEDLEVNFLNASQRAHVTMLRPARLVPAVRPLVEQLRKLSKRLTDLLGETQDKQALISAFMELLSALEPVGIWPAGYSRTHLKEAVEVFRNDDLKKQLEEAGPLVENDSEIDLAADSSIERLGRLDLTVIERTESFLDQIEDFVKDVERELSVGEGELSGLNPAAEAEELAGTLDQIDRDLGIIEGEVSE